MWCNFDSIIFYMSSASAIELLSCFIPLSSFDDMYEEDSDMLDSIDC
jgi:hypothetical protein